MRTLRVVAILVAASLASCAPRIVLSPRTPRPAVQLDLLRLPRLWVAGFVADGDAKVDLSEETARLLASELESMTLGGVVRAGVVSLTSTSVFVDQTYWQRIGEEHGSPLIVTGSVEMLWAPAVAVQRGRRATYVHGSGRVLRGTLVLIDGRTGAILATTELPQRTRYAATRSWSADTLYYELMDEALPEWLATLSAAYRPWSARTP